MSGDAEVLADYRSRAATQRSLRDGAERRVRSTGRARLIVFVVGAIATALVASNSSVVAVVVALVAIAAFVWLVRRHRRHVADARMHDALARACDHGVGRIERDWSRLPAFEPPPSIAAHPFASDLNLFGDVSLSRLLGPTSPVAGRGVIIEWLLGEVPPDATRLRDRQAAVAELAPLSSWREELGVVGGRAGHDAASIDRFLAWVESDAHSLPRSASPLARVLAVLTIGSLALAVARPTFWQPLAILCAVNLAYARSLRDRLDPSLHGVSARGLSLGGVADLFRHTTRAEWHGTELTGLRERLHGGETAAAFAGLARIASWGDLRFSPLAHVILQMLLLWDIHVVRALDGWRALHARELRDRFRALGELEAYAALATLAHDNPCWIHPRLDDSSVVEARALAHPLLPPMTRVANDVTIGPTGTFLLVTGSNMAGKSTLLRSVGLNVVLAQVGAPVCATAFSMPRVRLRTSIQIRDAIESGLSLFMAELVRLRAIVEAARSPEGPRLLYLADEMLHGTNADDRRIAVASVIGHLLRAGAIGAVATHDTALVQDPSMAAAARPIHFVEQYQESSGGPVMSFDYRARPGISTSRNALELLALMGLGSASQTRS